MRKDEIRKMFATLKDNYAPPAVSLELKVVNESGYPLKYATDGSIGLDLHACLGVERDVSAYLRPGSRWSIDTGIRIELPDGYGALVQPRSGMARDHGLVAVTGVIDRDYRGRIHVTLVNLGTEAYTVLPGDRIAQLVIVQSPRFAIVEVSELSSTDRGKSGFGSTGR